MSEQIKRCCGTCKWAKGFEKTPTGRFKDISGRCSVNVKWPPMPYFLLKVLPKKGGYKVSPDCWQIGIWPSHGESCEAWEAIE